MEAGLYIHIPFCKSKCAYCDFASFAGAEDKMVPYARALQQEIRQKAAQYPDALISTLFIGGGTPSLFPAALMDQVLQSVHEHFTFVPGAECTCECNPGTVTEEFLAVLKKHGINRLSFGAQASQEPLLQLLGRIHRWQDVEQSVNLAKQLGFHNINLDLMLGLPGQTEAHVKETLERALSLSPTHLSCYGLIVEEGTRMHSQVEKGLWQLPDEDTERRQYDICRHTLQRHGFVQYEISNFALPHFHCRHNMDCWQRKEYIGVGSAACGFMGRKRWQNPPSLPAYLAGEAPQEEFISPRDAMFETMMLGLRTMDGVSEEAFFSVHGHSLESVYGEKLQKPIREGLVKREKGRVFLTEAGLSLQNRILVELL